MKIKKNLKPIEHDVHLKYLCPNSSCCCPHWLSFKEASTKNFKVVCDCGQVFTVNRISNINIQYFEHIVLESLDRKNSGVFETENKPIVEQIKQEKTIKELAIDLMKTYGFTELESSGMIDKAMAENPSIDNHITLVKHSLFWINND